MAGYLLKSLGALMPVAAGGWVLKNTQMSEFYVLALGLAVFAAAGILIVRGPSARSLSRGFILLTAAYVLSLTVLGLARYDVLVVICEENHLIEWLSALLLLAAWVIGLILTIRLGMQRRPSPMAAFLTAGYFWGFWRELEFGAPFFGQKWIYSRNFFRPRAYLLDPGYFGEFNRSLGHEEHRPLFVMHWVGVSVVLVCGALLGVYLYRHRKIFVQELKQLGKTVHGKYFLLGAALYISSQIVEKLIGKALKSDLLLDYRRTYGLSERVIGEPFESLAPLAFLLSMVTFWNAMRGRRDADHLPEQLQVRA